MKRDMTGGAVVIATMAALADVGCPVRVIGLVAAAENSVGGDAMRPGDVIRHYGGRTSEVTNTDAEGRLVLADAMAYAVAELEPDVHRRRRHPHRRDQGRARPADRRLFANDDALADALLAAGDDRGRAAVAVPAGRRLRGQARLQGRRRRQRRRRPRRDHRRAVPAALRRRRARGPTSTSPRSATRPRTRHEWTAGPTGFGARALLAWLGSPDPLEGVDADEGSHRPLVAGDAPDGVEEELAAYVADTSHASSPAWPGCASRPGGCGRGSGSRAATSSPPTRRARSSRRRSPRARPTRRARRSSAARRS